ncbi:hypothetical protein DNTS_015292 [Danionella cerebrum]|uniref:SUN domain-containing protein n=1 Tax=Danionella cerebrum TaxID=2873325 RepID=A0A553QHE3_9TELE|nr:hypothetical protein DNTS_015292 [Danionella translucida]
MSRRSTRLVSKVTSFPDDDAASNSSAGSTSNITYKESPTRVFKRRSSRRATGSISRSSSRASSVSQIETATENYNVEPDFAVWDVLQPPAQALVRLYWWLGSAWYKLTSRLSLINVCLLSRCTADIRKSLLMVLILIFLVLGIWYWFPFSSLSPAHDVSRTPPPKHTDKPLLDDHLHHVILSNIKDDIRSLHEREAKLTRDIELLKIESEKQKLKSEAFETSLKSMKDQLQNSESEHDQQTSELKSGLSNLQTNQNLLKVKVDAQDALNNNLRAELSDWLATQRKDLSSLKSAVVLQPELQRVLEDLEKQIVDKLAQESTRDIWRTVGETLQQEGAGDATIQDVHEIVHRAISLYRADGIGLADYALESSGASVLNTRCSETYKTRSACLSLFGIPLWYQTESPRTVIQPELYPGKCWAFRGSQGFLVIALSYPVSITHVTLEHIPQSLSPTGRIDSAPKDFAVYASSDVFGMVELRILSNWGHVEYTCVYRFRVHGRPSLA